MVSTQLNMTGEVALAGVARPRAAGQCPNVSVWSFRMAGFKYSADVTTHPITTRRLRGPS